MALSIAWRIHHTAGNEFEAAGLVKALDGFNEAYIAFRDELNKRQATSAILFGYARQSADWPGPIRRSPVDLPGVLSQEFSFALSTQWLEVLYVAPVGCNGIIGCLHGLGYGFEGCIHP